jgi:hypothetical protein
VCCPANHPPHAPETSAADARPTPDDADEQRVHSCAGRWRRGGWGCLYCRPPHTWIGSCPWCWVLRPRTSCYPSPMSRCSSPRWLLRCWRGCWWRRTSPPPAAPCASRPDPSQQGRAGTVGCLGCRGNKHAVWVAVQHTPPVKRVPNSLKGVSADRLVSPSRSSYPDCYLTLFFVGAGGGAPVGILLRSPFAHGRAEFSAC